MRSSESVVSEMTSLYRTYSMKALMLYDDELNVNKNVVELMDRIAEAGKELGVAWKLRGFIKAELFTDEQAAAMYRAGFRWILVGFESGSSPILEVIQKRATLADNTRCMEIAKRHGLKVKALMSIGHPGETRETVEQTRKWLLDVKPDDFDVTIITCYPGTPYYDEAVLHKELPGIWVYTDKKSGAHLYQINVDYLRVADYYKGNPDGGYQSYVFTDALSPADLIRLRDEIEREVREKLSIPFNPSAPAMLYEHSMGQGGAFPGHILRASPCKT